MTIERDYGFGDTQGTVTIGGVPVTITNWGDATIEGTVPNGTTTGQLVVIRGDNGTSSITGVTVQVGLRDKGSVVTVTPGPGAIQTAINNAGDNDLILVEPGFYREMVIMWKPVQLQGWGEGSVSIYAINTPLDKLSAWRILAESLLTNGDIELVDGQELGFGGIEPATFFSEEGAGVFVVADSKRFAKNPGARIDGFTISGADTGGGIVVNGYGDYLDISNNRIVNNSAFFAGGVRIGHPMLTFDKNGKIEYSDAHNDNVHIHHNSIMHNGGLDGAGGGVGLHTGSDAYQVTDNFICGNFTTADGAGIAHYGFSDEAKNKALVPLIKDNTVIFNKNFNQGITVNGGGILVAGLPAFGCPIDPLTSVADPDCLTEQEQVTSPGSGSVQIIGNLLQGNSAGVGDGAGIRLSRINGQDVAVDNKGVVTVEWTIDVINNMIFDNVAALAGGGISLQDALDVNILHNTIANNNNASTSGDAFDAGSSSQSNPQPGAGIVSRAHSKELAQFLTAANPVNTFSDANLVDNIIWHNRKFFWLLNDDVTPFVSGLCPDLSTPPLGLGCTVTPGDVIDPVTGAVYDDLAVIGTTGSLKPFYSLLTDVTGYDVSNISSDPLFVAEYVNGNRNTTTVTLEGTTSMQALPAFDEGGNFIRLRYGPLTQTDTVTGLLLGDYHIQTTGSPAMDAGTDEGVADDFDGELRPNVVLFDIGADEIQQ